MAAAGHRTPFVGRVTELADLRGALAAARAGAGSLVLVSGPAGIGKTRLVEEAVAPSVAEVGVRWGRSVDDPGAPPLWTWRAVLRAVPGIPEDLPAGPTGDPAADRFRFVAAATDALLRAAEPAGLVVVLEDLHWADDTSLRLLRHLAGELGRSRLLVVGTHRDPAPPELARMPAALVVPLRPLSEGDVRGYLAAVTAGPLPDHAVRRTS